VWRHGLCGVCIASPRRTQQGQRRAGFNQEAF